MDKLKFLKEEYHKEDERHRRVICRNLEKVKSQFPVGAQIWFRNSNMPTKVCGTISRSCFLSSDSEHPLIPIETADRVNYTVMLRNIVGKE